MNEQKDSTARIETKLDSLIGAPGQIGRIPKLEEDVEELQASRNTIKGVSIAWGAFVTFGLALWEFLSHRK